jgi:hypothetical protein
MTDSLTFKLFAVYLLIGMCISLVGGGWRPHNGSRLAGIVAGIAGTLLWLPTIMAFTIFGTPNKRVDE